jgi:2-ketocyclohexanecarboxyl-CoA hydrolase
VSTPAFTDVLYDKREGIATVTINRPDVLNAFRAQTVHELIAAFQDAWADHAVGVVILTGVGERAFCTGGDQLGRSSGGYGGNGVRSDLGLDIEELHSIVRDIPKPVIAAVNGFAIGGGQVLQVLCDLAIASETAQFGQVGPRVGSVDAGFGTAYLVRLIGERKAREMWFLCRRYSAQQALEMGLVNAVVPPEQLLAEARAWACEILAMSPTALKLAKTAFNAASEHIRGISALGMSAVALYYDTDESKEGSEAFRGKRPPDFSRFRGP